MIGAALHDLPITGFPADADLAVADPLTRIASADPPYKPSEYSYVVIASPYDFDTAGLVELRSANDGGPSNVPYGSLAAGTEPYGYRVTRPYNIEARLPGVPVESETAAEFLPGGAVTPTVGEVAWNNEDGALDAWKSYDWTDRSIEVYVGAAYAGETRPVWPTEYARVLNGRTDRLGGTTRETSAFIRDFRRRLAVPLQTTLYEGTGGVEGRDELAGLPKPKAYGQVRQIEPIAIDPTNHVRQWNDGPVESVGMVRDNGADLSGGGVPAPVDYATYALLIAASTPAAGYDTCNALGLIRLGAKPAGRVTLDGEGDKAGSLGYTATAAGIVRKIATGPGGLTDPDEIELGAFDSTETDVPYVTGHYTGTQSIDVAEALDAVMAGVFGRWGFTRLGRLTVGRSPADPSTEPVDRYLPSTFTGGGGQQIEVDTEGFAAISHEQASAPVWRLRLPYRRYQAVLDPANVAAAVDEETRLDFGQEWRFAPDSDASIQTAVPSAGDLELPGSSIDTPADAATEVARLLSLLGTERTFYTVTVWNPAFQFEVGQIVFLRPPTSLTRLAGGSGTTFDLGAGKALEVVGIQENPAQTAAQVILTLWG